MKTLEFGTMKEIVGGASNRACMIGGALAGAAFISGFFTGGTGFFAAAAITAGGAYAGCFD